MKLLNCRTITEYSPRGFSEKSTELLMKMRRAGWSVHKFQIDTTAVKETGGNEVIGYTGVYIFESESDDET